MTSEQEKTLEDLYSETAAVCSVVEGLLDGSTDGGSTVEERWTIAVSDIKQRLSVALGLAREL